MFSESMRKRQAVFHKQLENNLPYLPVEQVKIILENNKGEVDAFRLYEVLSLAEGQPLEVVALIGYAVGKIDGKRAERKRARKRGVTMYKFTKEQLELLLTKAITLAVEKTSEAVNSVLEEAFTENNIESLIVEHVFNLQGISEELEEWVEVMQKENTATA